MAQGTVEEKVLALHREKRDLAEALLEGGDAAARLPLGELLGLISGAEGLSDEMPTKNTA